MRVRWRYVLPLAVLAAGGVALSWRGEEPTGFVEVKRAFAPLDARDVIRLNDAVVLTAAAAATDGVASVVVRQKTGAVRLDYARGDLVRSLCSFSLRKNRIVTATLTQTRNGIACALGT
jgi:hypothetical protein